MSLSGPPARADEPGPGFALRPALRVVAERLTPSHGSAPGSAHGSGPGAGHGSGHGSGHESGHGSPHGSDLTGAALHPGLPSEQAFGDLVLLVALACQAPAALLAVPGSDGSWRTLSHGFDSTAGLADPVLFDLVAASRQLVEIGDMTKGRPAESPLAAPPHLMRWAFGVSLRDASGSVAAVLVVLDRGFRQVTGREQRSLAAGARQLVTVFARAAKEGSGQVAPAFSAGRAVTGGLLVPGRAGSGGGGLDGRAQFTGSRAGAGLDPVVPVDRGGRRDRDLLRSHEVAAMFKVTDRTVVNWAAAGKLPSLRTVGGHLRFRQAEIQSVLDEVWSKGGQARFGQPGYAFGQPGYAFDQPGYTFVERRRP